MLLQNKIIQKQFNRFASHYDENCWIQTHIGNELIARAQKYLSPASRVLDLGCGSGKITTAFANKTFKQFFAIDYANDLLKIAEKRLQNFNTTILCADFNHIPLADQTIDLVFSNMTLQWSADIAETLNEIHRMLSARGILVFSLPIENTFYELRKSQDLLNNTSSENHFVTRESLLAHLKNSGYELLESEQQNITLTFDDIYELIHSFRKAGAGYQKNSKSLFRPKKYFQELEEIYRGQFTEKLHQQLPLTYSLFLGAAQKCQNFL